LNNNDKSYPHVPEIYQNWIEIVVRPIIFTYINIFWSRKWLLQSTILYIS